MFCLAFVLFAFTSALAQHVVKGQIISGSDNAPMIGVAVMEKGTTNGAVTDLDGNYQIKVASDATLTVSFIGYEPQEIAVAGQTVINITLKEESTDLNEIVVVGYGTQRREAVTGSVANMGGEKLNQIASSNVAQALQGRVAGVLMQQTSSQPGAEMQIRIRGQRSLTASNDPLIVLDGIPFQGSLSDINPSDIKSMDILKDASATAIYGSRGANGVIMITTIKGNKGQSAKFTYNGYIGAKTTFAKYPMMQGKKYVKMRELAGKYKNTIYESDDTNTDWQDEFLRTAKTMTHDLGVTGGTEGGSYSFGVGYYLDEGVIPSQQFQRISLRANLDQTVGKYFHFGLSTNTNYRATKGTNIGMYNVLSMSPLASPYDENGERRRVIEMPADKTWVLTKDVIEENEDNWINETTGVGTYNTFFGEVSCPWIEGLSYRVNVGLNFRSSKNGAFTGTGIGSDNAESPNSASVTQQVTKNWAVENLLQFDRTFENVHHVNFVGLYSAEQTTFEQTAMSGKSIPAEYFQYYNIGAATENITVDPNNQRYTQSGLMSWMGRLMYSYDNKYMLSVAMRADGSSRLAEGHKWHQYPAVSAGWNISRESFMESLDWLSSLKLRVGYGETSNQSIDPYSTLGTLSSRPYNFGDTYATGYYVSKLPNDELGWEYSTTWNYGIDYSLFNGRVSGSFEFYSQKTKDLLLNVNLPSTAGVPSYTGNIGETENKGFEFSVNGTIIEDMNGFSWDMGVNFYHNSNKLVALASGAEKDESNGWFVGHPIDVIYDYKKTGLWQKDDKYLDILEPGGNVGMIKVEYTGDYNADGTPTRAINADDRQIMEMDPKLLGGFNTTLAYKGLDLTIIGAFQVGGKLISTIHSGNGYLNMLSGRRGQLDVDYWTEENTGAKYPKPGGATSGDNPKYASTMGYFDAGYMKVRAITLGYNLERLDAIKNLGIGKLRVYATVQNPFVLFSEYTKECGLDPETNTYSNNGGNMAVTMGGHRVPVVGYNTPATRNFLFGLNITF